MGRSKATGRGAAAGKGLRALIGEAKAALKEPCHVCKDEYASTSRKRVRCDNCKRLTCGSLNCVEFRGLRGISKRCIPCRQDEDRASMVKLIKTYPPYQPVLTIAQAVKDGTTTIYKLDKIDKDAREKALDLFVLKRTGDKVELTPLGLKLVE